MKLAILLCCCAFATGQDTSPSPEKQSQTPARSVPEQKQQSAASPSNSFNKYGADMSPGAAIQQAAKAAVENHPNLGVGTVGKQFGSLDILSDTRGVDFGPYLTGVLENVRKNWYRLIPESAATKKGKLAIEFAITKDGQVADMRLVASSGDVALDRPAWGSITASRPFKPLPDKFTGQYLALRFRFFYNPAKSDLGGSGKRTSPVHSNEAAPTSSTPSKSGIAVNISSSGDLRVPVGESMVIQATVAGTKKKAVKWSLSGLGCSNSACGEMVGNLYVAPSVPPNPPDVTLTAISKADPTAKASVSLHIVESASH
ncbi:MAG TPA: TonB family protein [Candidatus Angelobacter sp.]|nr:TonB family protein [Candidatus Angelobacter sp.]